VFKRIRTKLAVVLAIPLVILVAVSYFVVSGSLSQTRSIGAQTDLATVSIGPDGLVSNLQTERNQATLQVAGLDSKVLLGVADARQARQRVDRAATTFRHSVDSHSVASGVSYQPALTALQHLGALRAQLDGYKGPTGANSPEAALFASNLFQQYTTISLAFFDANTRSALSVGNAQLRNGIELLDVALRQQEAESLVIRDAFLASAGGSLKPDGQLQSFVADLANYNDWTDRLSVLASGQYAAPVRAYIDGKATVAVKQLLASYARGGSIDVAKLVTASNGGAAPTAAGTAQGVLLQKQLGNLVTNQANHLRTTARDRLALLIVLAAIAAGLAITVVVLASRSITRPLQALAEQADGMAKTSLPEAVQSILDTPLGEDVTIPTVEPIRVNTRDEVAHVASALTTVQESAVHLAVEQALLRRNIADSLVNLGRRNQNLLGRQLDFISALEQKETDPAKLDELFRLDHLATRMRRNAESLLVLAGLESPRQWSAPVPVGDVVRASLAEVEDYRRVEVRQMDAATLPGKAAADVAHIIAELVENALASSPPDSPVEIFGRTSERDYLIVVVDKGVGMKRESLDQANLRLAGTESFTVAPSRYLGHYVAGSLARRYGITVVLQEADFGGIKAKVTVPIALLEQTSFPTSQAPSATVAPSPAAPDSVAPAPVAPAPVAPAPAPASLAPRPPVAPAPVAPAPVAPAPVAPTPVAPPAAPVYVAPPTTPNGLRPIPGGLRPIPGGPVPVAAQTAVPAPQRPSPVVADHMPLPQRPAAAPPPEPLAPSPVPPTYVAEPAIGADASSGGLARRVPGATIHVEDDDMLLRRPVDEEPTEGASAHEVYRMLSGLWDTDMKTPPARNDNGKDG
jgi:signal transduction histidine kinase